MQLMELLYYGKGAKQIIIPIKIELEVGFWIVLCATR
jgi:hypothetical protein